MGSRWLIVGLVVSVALNLFLVGAGAGIVALGLRLAQANGGALTVRTSLGQGSTFVVHLPLAATGHAGEPG